MIDRTFRWPEAVPLSSITSETCARAFISTWVSQFGDPALLTSDRGAQFTSSVWSEICSILGILRIKSTSFHPQSNRMIERFHRSLKSSLRARLASSDWVANLPLVMLGLQSLPKDISDSPQRRLFTAPLYLYQGSSSSTLNFLQRVSSERLNKQSRVSPDLLDIT